MSDQLDFLEHKTQSSSLDAFEAVQPALNGRRGEIHSLLKKAAYPVTNAEIGRSLKWPINTVTPRVNELVKMGIVEKCDRRKCIVNKSSIKVNTWFPKGQKQTRQIKSAINPRTPTTDAERDNMKDLIMEYKNNT